MNQPIKDVTFIVDRSGSMLSCQEQVVSGFNQFLADLQSQPDLDIRLTLTLFNTEVRLQHEGAHVAEVPPLTSVTYRPDGNTALYDALGKSIRALERRWQGNTEPTILVVVMTDGEENSSKEFSKTAIRTLIEQCEKQPNWTFVYLGANVDAWAEASQMGFTQANTSGYITQDTAKTFASTSQHTQTLLRSGEKKSGDFFNQPSPPVFPGPPSRPAPAAPPSKAEAMKTNPFAKPDPTRKK